MKILVVFTGGTIGSTVSEGWIGPCDNAKYRLLEEYNKTCSSDITFETLSPYTVLSENLSARHLNILIDTVRANAEKYDGIIITHGTDTLQYTSAALSTVFYDIKIPVAVVSSNYPLDDERANGNDNFMKAVDFLRKGVCGVFAVYKNSDKAVYVHEGSQLILHQEMSDDVYSLMNNYYGFYKNDEFIKNTGFIPPEKIPVKTDAVFTENPGILVVSVAPADAFSYDAGNYNAVILRPYHSGTLCTQKDSFVRLCKNAKEKNIPVYVVNVPSGVTYESSRMYEELGIRVLYSISFADAYIRIWLGLI